MRFSNKKFSLSLIIFIVVFAVYFNSKVITSTDSRWTIPTALSIIRNHNTNLDQYHNLIAFEQYYAIDSVNHHLYSSYSIGTTLMTIPFIYIIDIFYIKVHGVDIYKMEKSYHLLELELFIASFIVALAAVFIFLIAELILKNYFQSLIITLIFAFCTAAWSTASRALWQHGPSMLVLSIVLYILLKAKDKPAFVILCALPLTFSYVIRPTDFIPVLFLSLFVFINYRKYFTRFLLTALVIAIPFFIYNLKIYGALLTPYYLGYDQGHSTNYLQSVFGNLFSPARGLFIFSPVLLFSIIGMWFKIKNGSFKSLDFFLVFILVSHLLLFSMMRAWWAGWSFGPRYFTDVIPFFIYFLIAAFEWINTKSIKQKLVFRIILIPIICISFYINYRGATHYSTFDWNSKPNNINEHPERLWQWSDLQFLR
jgi:hypothetical protein